MTWFLSRVVKKLKHAQIWAFLFKRSIHKAKAFNNPDVLKAGNSVKFCVDALPSPTATVTVVDLKAADLKKLKEKLPPANPKTEVSEL